MSDRITIELKGFDSYQRAFALLGKSLTVTKQRNAMMPGARIIRDAIRMRAPIGTVEHAYYGTKGKAGERKGNGKGVKLEVYRPGALKKSIGIKWVKGAAVLFIGPGRAGKRKYPVWYGHQVEFGNANSPAQPFVRPGFESSWSQAEARMARAFEDAIYKETQKVLG